MSADCGQEGCPRWAGDAGCPCRVLGLTPHDSDGFMLDEDGQAWGHCNHCGEAARAEDECCYEGEVVP